MRRVRSDVSFRQLDLDTEESTGVQSATKHFLLFLLDAFARTVAPPDVDPRATLEVLCKALHAAQVLESLSFLSDYPRYHRKYLAPCGDFLSTLVKGAAVLTDIDVQAGERSGGSSGSGACTPRHGGANGSVRASARSHTPMMMSLTPPPSRFATEWEDLGPVGRGGYGAVHRARMRLDGALYAVKKIRLRSRQVPERVLREVKALARLSHAHIIRYHTSWLEVIETLAPSPTASPDLDLELELRSNMAAFTMAPHTPRSMCVPRVASVEASLSDREGLTSGVPGADSHSLVLTPTEADGLEHVDRRRDLNADVTLYIAMELCECTLQDWLERSGRVVQAADNVALLMQLVCALEYLHGLGIVHRDVKPSNCFLKSASNGQLTLRLGDFGLARDGSATPSPSHSLTNSDADLYAAPVQPAATQTDAVSSSGPHSGRLGTRTYAAPEQESLPPAPYTPAADLYAVGIILVELYTLVGTRMERSKLLGALRRHEVPAALQVRYPREAALASALLAHEPLQRPSATDALRLLQDCAPLPHTHTPLMRSFDRNRLASSTPD